MTLTRKKRDNTKNIPNNNFVFFKSVVLESPRAKCLSRIEKLLKLDLYMDYSVLIFPTIIKFINYIIREHKI